jgi:putative glutamine amidotransferase
VRRRGEPQPPHFRHADNGDLRPGVDDLVMRPLIGVTTSEVRRSEDVRQTRQGEPPQREMALGLKYLHAVEAAGGLPVVLPPLEPEAVRPLLAHLSGICLSGGPDLDPGSYGQREHPELGPIEPEVDRFELALARLAWREGLPVLAICRGAQALNVARGGTLVQHLPDEPGVTLDHRQSEPGEQPTHPVEVSDGSLVARLMGTRRPEVNSFHHQAAARLGRGLRVVGRSPDGVVEAIEAADRPFVVGVQWHAECLADREEQAALFEGLVAAAQRHAVEGRRPAIAA